MWWLLFACVQAPDTAEPLGGDVESFAELVQPSIEAAGCANSSCHGAVGRPLELYAPQRHRLDPERLYLDEPLTDEELRRNHDRARVFAWPLQPSDSPLLTEPLAPEAGGTLHGGGTQWEDVLDPGYGAVLAWIESLEAE